MVDRSLVTVKKKFTIVSYTCVYTMHTYIHTYICLCIHACIFIDMVEDSEFTVLMLVCVDHL